MKTRTLIKLSAMAALLMLMGASKALAWQPNGWVYHIGDYAYASGEGEWYYFNPGNEQRRVNLNTGTWGTLDDAVGWSYYIWPYAYGFNSSAWYYFNESFEQWVVALSTGDWSRFGEPRDSNGDEYISGPTFVTLSGVNTRFDFDTGQITEDTSAADLRFWAQQFGGEFIIHSFNDFSGTRYRPDGMEVANDREFAYHYYRTLSETDWREAENYVEERRIADNDTFLLRTSEGRIVKVFIIDVRGHFNHDDRPAVDFVYQFMDQVDNDPPLLETITVVTVDGEEVSQPLSDIIEFELDSQPEFLRLEFNEIVYNNRSFASSQEDSRWGPYPFFLSPYPLYYLMNGYLSDKFKGRIQGVNPDYGPVILKAGDDAYYSEREEYGWIDEGFYFSDLAGNRWTDLPFAKIIIRFATED